jgi:hypothetical protein
MYLNKNKLIHVKTLKHMFILKKVLTLHNISFGMGGACNAQAEL